MKYSDLTLIITTFIGLFISYALSNPDGFLNINCGTSTNRTVDGLDWISDLPFIKMRNASELPPLGSKETTHQYQSLAYFTNLGINKYCYVLPVKPGIAYLVRARFSYLGFEDLKLATVFDLFVGGTMWCKVDISNLKRTFNHYEEIILAARGNDLSVCLARNSQTQADLFVFISTIELRQLKSSMYNSTDFNNSALYLIRRRNFGISERDVCYPQDPFDRVWRPFLPSSTTDISKDHLHLGEGIRNQPPVEVLQTAVTSTVVTNISISGALDYGDDPLPPASYYFAFYFCNINQTMSLQNSTFQVLINDNKATDWLQFTSFLQCKAIDHILQLGPTESFIDLLLWPAYGSNMAPFINVAEVYEILDTQNMTNPQDVLAIREIAKTMNVPDDWAGGDPCFPADYSSTGIICSKEIPAQVTILNLTSKGLTGNIPPSIKKLTSLTQLLLGNNNLSGSMPDFSSLKDLTTLQLQDNQLTGGIPSSLEKLPMLAQLFLQNNKLNLSDVPPGLINKPGLDLRVVPQSNHSTDPERTFPTDHNKSHKVKGWIVGLLIGCLLLILIVISMTFLWRYKYRSQAHTKNSPIPQPQDSFADEDHNDYHRLAIEYTEEDIKAATNNYSTVIGHGGFGSVFYGRLSGYEVAVKILSIDSNQGQKEFRNEVTLLSRIYHKNLVKLVGYVRQPIVALIYEYMPCGTLKDHLYGIAKLEKPLDWHTRLNIAVQAAEGLLYLHQGCNPPIIHRDIKSNNILLDERMSAKVADLGLCKLFESSQSYITTDVKGTLGYLDPEYFGTASINEKSDVYSFGVVLLEIISGISPKEGIVESAQKLLSCGRLVDLMDSSLSGRYNLASAWKVAETAYTCVQQKPINRPKMSMVVKELEEAVALTSENNNQSGYIQSTSFNVTDSMPSVR